MPINEQKVVEVIMKNIANIDERYPGYSNDLKKLVAEVVALERRHQSQRFNIKQEKKKKVHELGLDLQRKIS